MAFGATPGEHDARTGSGFDLARMGPERLLVLFGGIAAVGFGMLSLALQLAGETAPRQAFAGYTALGGVVFGFAVAAAFGFGLLFAFHEMARRPAEGSVLALAFSIVLLAFGGVAGLIGGLVALVGALLGVVRNLRLSA